MVDVTGPDSGHERWLPLPEGYAPLPVARAVAVSDLFDCLRLGVADYRRHLGYGLAFGLFYVIAGGGLIGACLALGWGHLVFPALSGFLLFGPFAALGLYEISRRGLARETVTASAVFLAFRRHGGTQIALLGLALVIATLFWLKAATLIYALHYGLAPVGFGELLGRVISTEQGLRFAATGICAGALLAGGIFAATVFAVPLLLDRDVDVATAMATSFRTVADSAPTMLAWGAIVSLAMALGLAAGFVGLAVVLPVLGHATWHLYERALGAGKSPGAEARGRR